jgi:mannose-6-phosphate isomerase-like protein (cupin superfamily)
MTQSFWLFGTFLTLTANEMETESLYDFIEGRFQPGVETPLHMHQKYSELIYVLEGEFTAFTSVGRSVLHQGESILIPKNTPHVVAATGTKPARGLTVASPSGFARLIRLAGTPGTFDKMPAPDPIEMERFLSLSKELGDVILGPPGSRP